MLVSKLIDQLLQAQKTYGDFDVCICDLSDAHSVESIHDGFDFSFRLFNEKTYESYKTYEKLQKLPGISFEQEEEETNEHQSPKYFGVIFRDY
jgi:hypothetical protein